LTSSSDIFLAAMHISVYQGAILYTKKSSKVFGWEDVRVDSSGYYIIFDDSANGPHEAEKCSGIWKHADFFAHFLEMDLNLSDSKNTTLPVLLHEAHFRRDTGGEAQS